MPRRNPGFRRLCIMSAPEMARPLGTDYARVPQADEILEEKRRRMT